MTRGVLVALAMLLAGGAQERTTQVFRASTYAVVVNVAVFDGAYVVHGLGIDDFDVFDNGVRQTLASVERNVLPIDLRLVFDTSGSISEDDLRRYRRAMEQVAAELDLDDRCEIITFNSRIADAASRQSPPVAITLHRGGPDNTAFFDAVSLAMITVPTLDRRQVTVVLSDARDTASFFDGATMLEAARLTDAVVYGVLPASPVTEGVSADRLQALAVLTGGRLVRAESDRLVGAAIVDAMRDFRQSYVLRYTLAGVDPAGWHTLDVRVRGGRYRIRTKDGYFGG